MANRKEFICPDCGKPCLNLWDHGCEAAKPKSVPLTRDVPKATVKERLAAQQDRTPVTVRRISPNLPKKSQVERNRKYRQNSDNYRTYMKNYMRKWRAKPNE